MNKFILLLILSSAFLFTKAQSIQNTTWACYNTSSVLFRYYYFSTDTMYFATNLPSFTAFATFTVSADTISLIDFVGTCPGATGVYTFLIQNDSLRFTLVNDPCTARSNIIGSYYFVGITTGIPVANSIQTTEVFPNPSPDGIFNLILSKPIVESAIVSVYNSIGEKVSEEKISDKQIQQSINLQNQPSGIYFLIVQNDKMKQVLRILK